MNSIGGVELLVISEEVKESAETTEKPVEKGSTITDHVTQEPLSINLSCVLTEKTSTVTLDKLKKMKNDAKLISYVGKSTYNDMLILSISSLAQVENIDGYVIEITLIKPKLTKILTYKIKVKNPVTKKQDAKTATRVKPVTNKGLEPFGPPTPPQAATITKPKNSYQGYVFGNEGYLKQQQFIRNKLKPEGTFGPPSPLVTPPPFNPVNPQWQTSKPPLQ